MKTCVTCGKPKASDAFYSRADSHGDGLQGTCKECMKASKKRYRSDPAKHAKELKGRRDARRRNPDKARLLDRQRNIKTIFGLSEADYEYLMQKQGGVCAICGKPETARLRGKTKRLAIDHCHETGRIRGLLCSMCNRALGCFRNDIDILMKAASYVLDPIDPRMKGKFVRYPKRQRS